MSVKERMKTYVRFCQMSIAEFEKSINVTNGYVNNISKSIGIDKITTIIEKYSNLNIEWLLAGKGEMLKEKKNGLNAALNNNHGILLKAKENKGNRSMEYIIGDYNIPGLEEKGVKYLLRISDDSMAPKYDTGDLLACKLLQDLSFFQWGRAYVLNTEQGIIVKRLFPCKEDNDFVECHSDNKMQYPPFKIQISSLKEVALVVGVIRSE